MFQWYQGFFLILFDTKDINILIDHQIFNNQGRVADRATIY